MVLGGKTLLWCENGIVFLRPPQTFAGVSPTPEGAGSLFRLRPRAPWYYPREITFLPVVATSSFHPYLETSPISCSTARGNGAPRKVNEEGGSSTSSPSRSVLVLAENARERREKEREEEMERQKEKANGTAAKPWRGRQIRRAIENYTGIGFTSGRFSRADVPALIRVLCPYNVAISRRPRGARQPGRSSSRGLWDRLFHRQIPWRDCRSLRGAVKTGYIMPQEDILSTYLFTQPPY